MARMPLVVPDYPHHVTQRGNRGTKTFLSPDDYQLYLDLLADYKDAAVVSVWACCLMPNHLHFVVVPDEEGGLSRLFRRVRRAYSRYVNLGALFKFDYGHACPVQTAFSRQRAAIHLVPQGTFSRQKPAIHLVCGMTIFRGVLK